MDAIARYYPFLDARPSLPSFYLPLTFITTLLPFFLPAERRLARLLVILATLLPLFLLRPVFTVGSPSDDYSTATPPFSSIWQTIDFAIIEPSQGNPPKYIGDPKRKDDPLSEQDTRTFWERLKWAMRLQTTPRGIGWSWEVKNVPDHPDGGLPKWRFIRSQLFKAAYYFVSKGIILHLLGILQYCHAITNPATSPVLHQVAMISVGWCTTVYVWHSLQFTNQAAAAVTVFLGICSPWEWPPIVGPLSEAWSVRQMWSVTYHQIVRRMVQAPGQRLSRKLKFRKGSLSSKYLQLYLAFTLSMLLHEWNIFNATRKDGGEFRFFMLQPVIITCEDFIIWCYEKRYGKTEQKSRVLRWTGYFWTFMWFSFCLPQFCMGLLAVGILPPAGYEKAYVSRGIEWATTAFS